MAWSASLTPGSALGEKITFTPDTSAEGEYTVASFAAPRKGVYRFELMGSGGKRESAAGGTGGKTDGYLLLDMGQTVYVGAGGAGSAAFVASQNAESLASVPKAALFFVAGAGGGGGKSAYYESDKKGAVTAGGHGGGVSGTQASGGGKGGTQEAGGAGYGDQSDGTLPVDGAYGAGGLGGSDNSYPVGTCTGGRGGDGYYGGGGGGANASTNSATGINNGYAYGGGGGSGYVKTAALTVLGRTYASVTEQGGGAASDGNGSVAVTYYARCELPIRFDGAAVERLFFNGTEIGSLVYNGVKLFMRRWMRCLRYPGGQSACRAATQGSLLFQ
ncbi:MAG: hypothetical protein IKU73_02025 [Clostridia bacterium]|nr:hypothetical protein [Clostridia bacterium]